MFIALIANQYTLIKIIVQKYFQFVPVNYKYFFICFCYGYDNIRN